MQTVSELTALIDVYAGAVGLTRSLQPGVAGEEGEQGIRWEAPYAQLVLWPIQSTGKAKIHAEVEKAQEILDRLLVAAEKRLSGVIDGYLLLFLEYEPDEDLHSLDSKPRTGHQCLPEDLYLARGRRLPRREMATTVAHNGHRSALNPRLPGVWWTCLELKGPCKEIWREINRSGSANAARKELMECRRW